MRNLKFRSKIAVSKVLPITFLNNTKYEYTRELELNFGTFRTVLSSETNYTSTKVTSIKYELWG